MIAAQRNDLSLAQCLYSAAATEEETLPVLQTHPLYKWSSQKDSSPACWHSDTRFWKLLIDFCANFTAFIGWRRSYYCLGGTLFGLVGKYHFTTYLQPVHCKACVCVCVLKSFDDTACDLLGGYVMGV